MNLVALKQTSGVSRMSWWEVPNQIALVWRTAAKDCNKDEFDQFVAVARELGLNPLRKQIYAFVFNKDDATNRNMAIVIGIDGFRSVAAKSGNYRPDDRSPEWIFDENAKDPLSNPLGLVSCTVGVYHRPTRNDPFERIVATVFWDEFAPIVRTADPDAYVWVDTDEVYPQGHKKAGEIKRRKQLRHGASADVTERLDPKKKQWNNGRHKLSLCAESQVLRRGWPDDFARIYVEEEVDRANSLLEDVEFQRMSPSEMVDHGEAAERLARIGGPALFATFDDTGTLERVPIGQFADRVNAHIEKLDPAAVALWVDRNKAAMNEFWAHNKTDALTLKKILETRSGAVASAAASDEGSRAKAAPPQHGDTDMGGAAQPAKQVQSKLPKLTGLLAERHRDNLIRQIRSLDAPNDFPAWGRDGEAGVARLPDAMAEEVRAEFASCKNRVGEMQR